MDLKYLIIFIITLVSLSIIIFLICKTYFENKKNVDDQTISAKDEISQISELKGAVSQLSSTIEERLGNFGSTIGNSLTQQTQNTPTNAQWISSTTGLKKQPNPTVASVMVAGPKMESIRRSAHPSNSKRFQLEYDIDAVGPAGAKSVELWMTPDGGGSWRRMAVDEDLRSPVDAVVDREGVFGFRILVIGNDGLRARQPRNGDPADMWVNVDTTMPTVKIKAVPYGRGQDAGNLMVQWNATDANLRMRPIKLSWSPTGQAPWTTIEDGIRNEGQYAWKPAANVPDQIYLKLDVRDVAGNTATHQLNRPIDVSGLLPRGHIRGITPIREVPPSNSDTST